MSYQALYRKLRPKTFADVRGQDHIIKTLKNQIIKDHITHAYLFCGTRGTGKTSTAKLFAKAINCFNLEDGEPCNKCESCIEINNQTTMDVIEIDAASNNSVENIREIVNEVKYTPTISSYKIYIIDEVHMLSIGAFNALLKTLEEPPNHIIFILATTDPQKIPATILSRCQRFDFKRITVNIMVQTLKEYMELEGKEIDNDALRYISSLADGAMRDALSILDQCISFYFDETITLNKVLDIIGSAPQSVFDNFIRSILDYDTTTCMQLIDEIIISGKDIFQFIQDCIQYLRDILIIKATSYGTTNINMSEDNAKKTYELYENISSETLLDLIKQFSVMSNEIKYATNKRIIFEVNCIKLMSVEVKEDSSSLIKRIEKLELNVKRLPQTIQVQSIETNDTASKIKQPTPTREKAVPDDIQNAINNFHNIANDIPNIVIKKILLKSRTGYIDDNVLNIIVNDESSKSILENDMHLVLESLASAYNKDFKIKVTLFNEYSSNHKATYGVDDETILKELRENINFENIEVIE